MQRGKSGWIKKKKIARIFFLLAISRPGNEMALGLTHKNYQCFVLDDKSEKSFQFVKEIGSGWANSDSDSGLNLNSKMTYQIVEREYERQGPSTDSILSILTPFTTPVYAVL